MNGHQGKDNGPNKNINSLTNCYWPNVTDTSPLISHLAHVQDQRNGMIAKQVGGMGDLGQ